MGPVTPTRETPTCRGGRGRTSLGRQETGVSLRFRVSVPLLPLTTTFPTPSTEDGEGRLGWDRTGVPPGTRTRVRVGAQSSFRPGVPGPCGRDGGSTDEDPPRPVLGNNRPKTHQSLIDLLLLSGYLVRPSYRSPFSNKYPWSARRGVERT